jgi:hypothetical protein
VEAKSTTSNDPAEVYISNIRQLDATGVLTLFLCHLVFDARRGGEESLPEIVDDVRHIVVVQAPARSLMLEEKLLACGYLDADRHRYMDLEYSLRFYNFYSVSDEFPRLLESDIPNGVEEVTYSVNLNACRAFERSFEDVKKALKND